MTLPQDWTADRIRMLNDVYKVKRKPKQIRKRCAKCGAAGFYNPSERKCKLRRFGRGSYCCWGDLSPVTRKTATGVPAGLGIGHVLTEEYEANRIKARGEAHRARAEKARKKAARMTTQKRRIIARTEKLLAKWEATERREERKAEMTDDEVEAVRLRAKHAAHVGKVRRRLLGSADTEPMEEDA